MCVRSSYREGSNKYLEYISFISGQLAPAVQFTFLRSRSSQICIYALKRFRAAGTIK